MMKMRGTMSVSHLHPAAIQIWGQKGEFKHFPAGFVIIQFLAAVDCAEHVHHLAHSFPFYWGFLATLQSTKGLSIKAVQ